jgi:hypothetical protein
LEADVNQAKPGHLAAGPLNLKQSDKVRKELSKAAKAHWSLKKISPVNLGWQGKGREG